METELFKPLRREYPRHPDGPRIQADVQLSPRPARLGAMLLQQPLARAAQAQSRAVHQQVQGFAIPARLRARHIERPGPAAQGGMVRHRQSEPEQADDGADQALGLAQSQVEHRSQREGFRMASGEYQGCPPGVVRDAARQPSIASSVNQTVRLPRWRKAAS